MFESIILDHIHIESLPKYKKTNLYLYQNQLLKIVPPEEQNKIMTIHHFFLNHPIEHGFVPEKALFLDGVYVGYSMSLHPEYQPIRQYKMKLSKEEKWNLIHEIKEQLLSMNEEFIYTDIDEDNILFNGTEIKFIDFDDIRLKSQLSTQTENELKSYQKFILDMFTMAFLYNVSILDIYYLKESTKLTENQKREIKLWLNEQSEQMTSNTTIHRN